MTGMTDQKPIEVVSATRLSRADFMQRSALGLSLQRLADARITASIAFQNRVGLPAVYNHRLAQSSAEVLLFVHDDVWIDDIYLADRLLQACAAFDVVGVVGNTHCGERQVSWAFTDEHLTWDAEERLSGAIANGTEPFGRVSRFGSSTTSCRLVDGAFIAVNRAAAVHRGARFDEQFSFHFYDMDFCREAHARGLRIGTWPISITHQSGGNFRSDEWREACNRYRQKWEISAVARAQ